MASGSIAGEARSNSAQSSMLEVIPSNPLLGGAPMRSCGHTHAHADTDARVPFQLKDVPQQMQAISESNGRKTEGQVELSSCNGDAGPPEVSEGSLQAPARTAFNICSIFFCCFSLKPLQRVFRCSSPKLDAALAIWVSRSDVENFDL